MIFRDNISIRLNVEKQQMHLKAQGFSLRNLSEEELRQIAELYHENIQDVRGLSEAQKWLLEEKDVVSSGTCLQSLFKVCGAFLPQVFSETVRNLTEKYAVLRAAFVKGSNRFLQVILKARAAEVVCHQLNYLSSEEIDQTLDRIMQADRRRGFQLEKDSLLRIGVYCTGNREYAIFISQPQVVADAWDLSELFHGLFENSRGQIRLSLPRTRKFSFTEYLRLRSIQDKEPARRYWMRLMDDLPNLPRLPGYVQGQLAPQPYISMMRVGKALTKRVEALSSGNRTCMTAYLHTAWGLMLQSFNKTRDTYFCSILSNRTSTSETVGDTAGIMNIMPVRVDCRKESLLQEVLRKQYMQLLVSQPLSYCTLSELKSWLGRKGQLFQHFLNFHGFFMENYSFSKLLPKPGVQLAYLQSFDSRATDLGVYFRLQDGEILVEFSYDQTCFPGGQIAVLQESFMRILNVMVKEPKAELEQIFENSTLFSYMDHAFYDNLSADEIAAIFRRSELFAVLSLEELQTALSKISVRYCLEKDLIATEGEYANCLYFVLRGQVEISRASAKGWQGSLGVVTAGNLVGLQALEEGKNNKIRIEALSSDVIVGQIPRETMLFMLRNNSEFAIKVLLALQRETEKYQKLYVDHG